MRALSRSLSVWRVGADAKMSAWVPASLLGRGIRAKGWTSRQTFYGFVGASDDIGLELYCFDDDRLSRQWPLGAVGEDRRRNSIKASRVERLNLCKMRLALARQHRMMMCCFRTLRGLRSLQTLR